MLICYRYLINKHRPGCLFTMLWNKLSNSVCCYGKLIQGWVMWCDPRYCYPLKDYIPHAARPEVLITLHFFIYSRVTHCTLQIFVVTFNVVEQVLFSINIITARTVIPSPASLFLSLSLILLIKNIRNCKDLDEHFFSVESLYIIIIV